MKKYIIIILSLYSLTSCEEEINLSLPSPVTKLVVEGRIELIKGQTETEQQIILSTLNDFFDASQTPRVNNAEVEVYDSKGNSYNFILDPKQNGRYINDELKGEIGETYTVNIIWENEVYQGSETLVAVSTLDRVYQQFEEENTFEDGGIKLAIDFKDPVDQENYYFWEIYAGNENIILPDPGNSGNLIARDKYWNGNFVEGYLPNEEKVFDPGEELIVRHIGISKAHYEYLFLLFEQTGQTGQFTDIPPALIKGNIRNLTNPDNIAMGYFSASEIDEKSIVINE